MVLTFISLRLLPSFQTRKLLLQHHSCVVLEIQQIYQRPNEIYGKGSVVDLRSMFLQPVEESIDSQ